MFNPLPKILPVAAAAAMSFIVLGAATQPVQAARGPDYRLTAQTAQSGKFVAADTLWACGADGCTAAKSTSRPSTVCASAARQIGTIASFTFRDEMFDAEALAKCNAKAR
jgi:hypothetical protein